jgi:predicted secreted Zn-dependent protease
MNDTILARSERDGEDCSPQTMAALPNKKTSRVDAEHDQRDNSFDGVEATNVRATTCARSGKEAEKVDSQ